MRVEIEIDDELAAELDRRMSSERRSEFIAELIRNALEDERWNDIESALAQVADVGHAWDADVAQWVRTQRQGGRSDRSG